MKKLRKEKLAFIITFLGVILFGSGIALFIGGIQKFGLYEVSPEIIAWNKTSMFLFISGGIILTVNLIWMDKLGMLDNPG